MKRFMLDSDTVSYALRGAGGVATQLRLRGRETLCVSAITAAELRYGAERRKSPRLHDEIEAFLGDIDIVAFDAAAATQYALLAAELESRGTPLDDFDLLIAAHAIALGATLVTNNLRHFSRIARLEIANWF